MSASLRTAGPGAAGGGTLLDFGSHLVDQALVVFGDVLTVYAEMHTPDVADALDDDVFLALTHANGVHSHLWGSWRQHAPGPRFRVTGTDASYVVVPDMDGQEARLVSGQSPATESDWGIEPSERWGRVYRGGHVRATAVRARRLGCVLSGVRDCDPREGSGTGRSVECGRHRGGS